MLVHKVQGEEFCDFPGNSWPSSCCDACWPLSDSDKKIPTLL